MNMIVLAYFDKADLIFPHQYRCSTCEDQEDNIFKIIIFIIVW